MGSKAILLKGQRKLLTVSIPDVEAHFRHEKPEGRGFTSPTNAKVQPKGRPAPLSSGGPGAAPVETRAECLYKQRLMGPQKLPVGLNIQPSATHSLAWWNGMKGSAGRGTGFSSSSPPCPFPGSEFLKGDELFKTASNRC